MSVDGRDPRRTRLPRAIPIAAALALFQAALFAAPVEVPRLDAPVGSGSAQAAPSAGAAVLSPSLLAPAAPGLTAAPAVLPPAAVLAAPAAPAAVLAPAAVPAAVLAAPAAPALASGAKAAPSSGVSGPGGFGRRVVPPARDGPAAEEQAWSRSSALFDLSAERADAAAVPAGPGLPENAAGKVLAKLRRAGERGGGPGAIPGMARVEWAGPTGRGYSGESTKVRVDGKLWFLKKLGSSPDAVIDATPPETRARNEAGLAAVLRADPQLGRSFSVAPRVSVFRDGKDVFVLSEGLPALGDGESRRQDLSAEQRADAAVIQLVLGLGDMHGADVLPLGGGRFGLVDFEKLARAPLPAATPREIDEQVMLKNYPLVDRLSANDPALYRSRFERWRADYAAVGRGRMDRALTEAGWTAAEREAFLAAVDRNAATYLERLEPYLRYANDWHGRILEARAEAARRKPEPKRGFLGGLFGGGKDGR